MVKELVKYPDPSIRRISGNVRFFDDNLRAVVSDMIDTMKANNLKALSAILIGIDLNIIALNRGNGYEPYINSRIIKHSKKTTATERSIYYDGISVDVERYEKITVVYEDLDANVHNCDFEGEEARIFQQHLDHCFGSTFVDRVDKEVKQRINDYLEFGLVKDSSNGSCPTVFYRDYIKRAAKYTMLAIFLTFIVPFFTKGALLEYIYAIEKYIVWLVPALIIGYFFYAQYESQKYKQCTSCQIGNILGSVFIMFLQLLIILLGVFIWMQPKL